MEVVILSFVGGLTPWFSEADGLRLDSHGRILCPVRLITGELVTTQSIPAQGKKLFFKGTTLSEGFHAFGSIEDQDEIFLVEGIATAKIIREASSYPAICTYGKRFNIIAPIISKKYPDKKLTYCCDIPSEGEKSTSAENAKKAISLAGGTYTLPDFSMIPADLKPEIQRTDFNDLFVLLMAKGLNRTAALDIVRQQLSIHTDEVIMTKTTKEKQPKQSEILLDLISEDNRFEFFKDDHQDGFCRYPSKELDNNESAVFEIRRISDKKFKNYLSYSYRQATGKTIGEQALKEVLSELEGRAIHDKNSKLEKVFIRCGEKDGKIYIDLCNEKWQAVEISSEGWKILNSSDIPVRFERTQHALPLPNPHSVETGDIDLLWGIVNIPEADQILVLAFILECYRCNTAFPILVLLGLQDSGKSATQNTIRSLIDPSSSNLRTPPRKSDDIVIDARGNYFGSYNNVSSLTDDMHDDLCSVSTGSGFSTRRFFTNTDQVVFNIARPVAMNGIYNFIRRPDLLDRAIIIELASIDEATRKTDSELDKALKKHLPVIFRGLLDLMVDVLRTLPNVSLAKIPRMADFALLGIATEQALKLQKGTFINRYRQNRAAAKEGVIESSPVILALIDFIEQHPDHFWRGRPSDLLEQLTALKTPSQHTTWPKTAHKMAGELRRYASALLQCQIKVVYEKNIVGKKNNKGNIVQISKEHNPQTEKQSPQSPFQNDASDQQTYLKKDSCVDLAVDMPVDLHDGNHQSPSEVHTNVHSHEPPAKPYEQWAQATSEDQGTPQSGHGGLQNPTCTSPADDGDSALLI